MSDKRLHTHDLAGKAVPDSLLENIPALVSAFFTDVPDPAEPTQRVSFGTSGHRGTSSDRSFNEAHVLAITQAICDYRAAAGIDGPLFLGKDTHALSEAAHRVAVEVMAANGVHTRIAENDGFTPTPAISHAILNWNREHDDARADGIVMTPSHNPASDGGFKYNPPSGGPAPGEVTATIEKAANDILEQGVDSVKRIPYTRALTGTYVTTMDYMGPYVRDLPSILNMEAIRHSGIRIGADALGGAGLAYWDAIADVHGLDVTTRNVTPDPTFRFMHVDHDGNVRMDCSSPAAMAGLIQLRDQFDIAFGNDPDFDRHGIVTPSAGLMNPNHFLAVAVQYLFSTRRGWGANLAVGKTVVTTSMIDRVAESLQRKVVEVPVGFKWFVDGLLDGSLAFGGEESAGASFVRQDGSLWTTDKDGMILALLAAEITAETERDPSEHYDDLTGHFGSPVYKRIDAPATPTQKAALKDLSADNISTDTLGGEPITAKITQAPGNGQPIGGLKVMTESGWFAARPSGTEDIYKIYAESFRGPDHLDSLLQEAQDLVAEVMDPIG